jgi:hypothetical protein
MGEQSYTKTISYITYHVDGPSLDQFPSLVQSDEGE